MNGSFSAARRGSWGAINLAGHQVPVRMLVCWIGVTLWLANMIVHTGSSGVAELRASLSFVAEMVLITSATRTITLDLVVSMYCLGGTMMGVMYLLSLVFTAFVPSPDAVSRQFVVPILEESLKLAPVAFVLWRNRGARTWTMGASDTMLMGAACGAGFGLVEEAYFHHHLGPTRAIDWFPLTRINGVTLTIGHSSWTGLAGATLGLALLWKLPKHWKYPLAASGILWSIIDHSHHNYGVDRSGLSVELFNYFTGHGWIALYLFVMSVIAAVASDFYVVQGTMSGSGELGLPRIGGSLEDLKRAWRFLLARRGLAYLMFKQTHVPLRRRAELMLQAYTINQLLIWFHKRQSTTPLGVANEQTTQA